MNNLQMVVDAKYKPRYENSDFQKEDVRQVSGYARMVQMYKELGMEQQHSKVIDALIVYSSQSQPDELSLNRLFEDPSNAYVRFFKVGICLPEVETV